MLWGTPFVESWNNLGMPRVLPGKTAPLPSPFSSAPRRARSDRSRFSIVPIGSLHHRLGAEVVVSRLLNRLARHRGLRPSGRLRREGRFLPVKSMQLAAGSLGTQEGPKTVQSEVDI